MSLPTLIQFSDKLLDICARNRESIAVFIRGIRGRRRRRCILRAILLVLCVGYLGLLYAPAGSDETSKQLSFTVMWKLDACERFSRWEITFQEQGARGTLHGARSFFPLCAAHNVQTLVQQFERGCIEGDEYDARREIWRQQEVAVNKMATLARDAIPPCYVREREKLAWDEARGRRDIEWQESHGRRLACVPFGCMSCWSEPSVRQAMAALGPHANERAEEFATCRLLGIDVDVSRAVFRQKYEKFIRKRVESFLPFSIGSAKTRQLLQWVSRAWLRMDERLEAIEKIQLSERLQQEGIAALPSKRIIGEREWHCRLVNICQRSRQMHEQARALLQLTLSRDGEK